MNIQGAETQRHSQAPPPAGKGLSLAVPFKGSYLNVQVDAGGQVLTKAHIERVREYLRMAGADLEQNGDGNESQE